MSSSVSKLADLDGDAAPDLVTANALNTVSGLLGNRDGSFGPPLFFIAAVGPESVVLADLNGDAVPNLVTVNAVSDDVSVLLPEPSAWAQLVAAIAFLAASRRRKRPTRVAARRTTNAGVGF